jgi:hypothetical protein
MPKVGSKQFSYSPKGKAAAKKFAKKSGKMLTNLRNTKRK